MMKRIKVYFFPLLFIFMVSCKPASPKIVSLHATPETQEEGSAVTETTKPPVVAVLPTPTDSGRSITEKDSFVYDQNAKLGRGITVIPFAAQDEDSDIDEVANLLNLIAIEDKHIQAIKDAGFDSVILPVSWSNFAKEEPPYELDLLFLDQIKQLVDNFLAADLHVVLYFDDYQGLNDEPRLHTERFLTLWDQIADYFKNYQDELFFGIYLNPQGTFASTAWNETANNAIDVIRKTNPDRTLMLGADFFNPNFLPGFLLPDDDRNLIVTFSFFQPFQFTVQGINEYLEQFVGTTWDGTEEEINSMDSTMDTVAKYSRNNARPISLTTFAVSQKADDASRARWLNAVARATEDRDMSWFYLGFANASSDDFPFGIYDFESDTWDQNVLQALNPK